MFSVTNFQASFQEPISNFWELDWIWWIYYVRNRVVKSQWQSGGRKWLVWCGFVFLWFAWFFSSVCMCECVRYFVAAAPCHCWCASSCPGAVVQAHRGQRRYPTSPSDCLLWGPHLRIHTQTLNYVRTFILKARHLAFCQFSHKNTESFPKEEFKRYRLFQCKMIQISIT